MPASGDAAAWAFEGYPTGDFGADCFEPEGAGLLVRVRYRDYTCVTRSGLSWVSSPPKLRHLVSTLLIEMTRPMPRATTDLSALTTGVTYERLFAEFPINRGSRLCNRFNKCRGDIRQYTLAAARHIPSLGYQAQQTSEFGNEIGFAGSSRSLTNVEIIMSDWANQADYPGVGDANGYDQPLTLNFYNPGSGTSVGSLIANKRKPSMFPGIRRMVPAVPHSRLISISRA